MASVASDDDDEPVIADDKACLDLYNAAIYGTLDEVNRLLPVATEKGVVNQVCSSTEKKGRERGGHVIVKVQRLSQCHAHYCEVSRFRLHQDNW